MLCWHYYCSHQVLSVSFSVFSNQRRPRLENFFWVGRYVNQRLSSFFSFALANGTMSVVPTALSLIVSFLSAITLLGTPSEMYIYGTMYVYRGEFDKMDWESRVDLVWLQL